MTLFERNRTMSQIAASKIPEFLGKYESELLVDWIAEQKLVGVERSDLMSGSELRGQSAEFLRLVCQAAAFGNLSDIGAREWNGTREMLGEISRSRALQGFSPKDVCLFIFSLKRPLFSRLRIELGGDVDALFAEIWTATTLLDHLGYWTTEVFQKAREEIISRQQDDMLELSTPVVSLWEGILALPMIGTLDSNRAHVVMESLLQRIVDTGSEIAIIDITGVLTVDTLTAQHLLKTVDAARLMGADCIISGIRPQIAQTIVHLGVDLSSVATKATLADAFKLALKRTGRVISRTATS
jgi:rsbT co-antagonist protein RsbR